jgi:adenosylmethionine-8-amino-7-oxononanoate aminotransferase
MPPYCIDDADLDRIYDALGEAVLQTQKSPGIQ